MCLADDPSTNGSVKSRDVRMFVLEGGVGGMERAKLLGKQGQAFEDSYMNRLRDSSSS